MNLTTENTAIVLDSTSDFPEARDRYPNMRVVPLYVSFGVPSAVAVAVVLIYRIINFWLPIPPGFIAYAIVRPGRRAIAEGEVEAAAGEAPGELNGRGR